MSVNDIGLEVIRETEDLVAHMGDIEVHKPLEVLVVNGGPVEIELESGIAHVTDIGPVAAVADGRRSAELEQHVGSLAVEVIDATGKAALPKVKLKSGVEVGIGLPGNVLGTLLAPLVSDLIVVVHHVI